MKVFVLLAVLAFAAGDRIKGTFENPDFQAFKARFGKVYAYGQETKHHIAYLKNVDIINQHNDEYDRGLHTYYMGVNQYTDFTAEEFSAILGFKEDPTLRGMIEPRNGNPITAPSEKDWRQEGAVLGIKDQGSCGSCWAFSTINSVEGIHKISQGQLTDTSEQQLVSCDTRSNGCGGGDPYGAYQYIQGNGQNGVDTQQSYPYTASDSRCDTQKTSDGQNVAAVVTGYTPVSSSESALKEAVGNVGPVSVCFQISSSFQHYSGGIFDDPSCPGIGGHCVNMVGYTSSNWILRNSWGSSWGESGYMRVVYGKNTCGLAGHSSYAHV